MSPDGPLVRPASVTGPGRAADPERWSGAWIDLVDVVPGESVEVLGEHRGLRDRLAHRGITVEAGAPTLVCPPSSIPAASLDGPVRLVCVVDRRWTLTALVERRRGDRLRGRTAGFGPTMRRLRRSGWAVEQRHALVRSSRRPVAAVDLDAPIAATVTIDALLTLVRRRGPRAVGLRALRWCIRHRQGQHLAASVLITARRQTDGTTLRTDRITGQIAVAIATDVLYLRGEPPVAAERRSDDPNRSASEAAALVALAEAGFHKAPRLLDRPSADRTVVSWLPGTPLDVTTLSDDELVDWARRAATLLQEWQDLTRDDHGQVIVHGDYWLGNLLVEGAEISGVVDWAEGHRGSSADDGEFLVRSTVERTGRSVETAARLREAVADVLGPPRRSPAR